jgi:hypothetical protein
VRWDGYRPAREVFSRRDGAGRLLADSALIVTGTHRQRHGINVEVRSQLGRETWHPQAGDLLRVRRNAFVGRTPLANGDQLRLESVRWLAVEKRWLATGHLEPEGTRLSAPFTFDGSILRRAYHEAGHPGARHPSPPPAPRRHTSAHAPHAELSVDWGWASTAHAAQGSEREHVIVHASGWMGDHEPYGERGRRRWLYTAASRATRHLELYTSGGVGHALP